MTAARIGTWAWGITTVILAVTCLVIVGWSGLHIHATTGGVEFFGLGANSPLPGLFYALKENGNVVAGILGFSGLAWTHFYAGRSSRNRSTND
jgi:hypothetical protein